MLLSAGRTIFKGHCDGDEVWGVVGELSPSQEVFEPKPEASTGTTGSALPPTPSPLNIFDKFGAMTLPTYE